MKKVESSKLKVGSIKAKLGFSFIFIIYSSLFTLHSSLFAAGETALNFLRIGTSARGASLADALAADYTNTSVLEYNPAALGRLKGSEAQLMHINLYAGIDYESAVYARQFDKFNLSMTLNYLHTTAPHTVIDVSDPYGYKRIGNFAFQDRCLSIAITPAGSIWGGRVKYIEERIDDESAAAAAVDFGFLLPGKLSFAGSVRNIGPEIKFIDKKEKLPMTVSAASRLDLKLLSLFIEENYYTDRKPVSAAAAEIKIANIVFMRAGYKYIPEKNGEFPGFTLGAGFKIRKLGFDWAFIPFGELGNTQRFSLWLKF